jgi:hypothetical protein
MKQNYRSRLLNYKGLGPKALDVLFDALNDEGLCIIEKHSADAELMALKIKKANEQIKTLEKVINAESKFDLI